ANDDLAIGSANRDAGAIGAQCQAAGLRSKRADAERQFAGRYVPRPYAMIVAASEEQRTVWRKRSAQCTARMTLQCLRHFGLVGPPQKDMTVRIGGSQCVSIW